MYTRLGLLHNTHKHFLKKSQFLSLPGNFLVPFSEKFGILEKKVRPLDDLSNEL